MTPKKFGLRIERDSKSPKKSFVCPACGWFLGGNLKNTTPVLNFPNFPAGKQNGTAEIGGNLENATPSPNFPKFPAGKKNGTEKGVEK